MERNKREREEEKGRRSGQCVCIAVSFHSGIEAKKARRYRGCATRNRDDRAHYNGPFVSRYARASPAKQRALLLLQTRGTGNSVYEPAALYSVSEENRCVTSETP